MESEGVIEDWIGFVEGVRGSGIVCISYLPNFVGSDGMGVGENRERVEEIGVERSAEKAVIDRPSSEEDESPRDAADRTGDLSGR